MIIRVAQNRASPEEVGIVTQATNSSVAVHRTATAMMGSLRNSGLASAADRLGATLPRPSSSSSLSGQDQPPRSQSAPELVGDEQQTDVQRRNRRAPPPLASISEPSPEPEDWESSSTSARSQNQSQSSRQRGDFGASTSHDQGPQPTPTPFDIENQIREPTSSPGVRAPCGFLGNIRSPTQSLFLCSFRRRSQN